MGQDMTVAMDDDQLALASAEAGLSVLLEACERAVEEVGSTVPPVQLRALLVIEGAGSLNLNRLAGLLGASASAASRLCDRMQAAGLVSRDRAILAGGRLCWCRQSPADGSRSGCGGAARQRLKTWSAA